MLEYWVISRRTVVECRAIDAMSLEDAKEKAGSSTGCWIHERETEEILSITPIDQEE